MPFDSSKISGALNLIFNNDLFKNHFDKDKEG